MAAMVVRAKVELGVMFDRVTGFYYSVQNKSGQETLLVQCLDLRKGFLEFLWVAQTHP